MQSEKSILQKIVEDTCEILNTSYTYEEEVFYIDVTTEEDNSFEVSIYQTVDSFEVEKIDCTVTVRPIVKNLDLLYTFLKNNFELDYGSFAIIHEDGVDLLVMVDSLLLESCTAEGLASVVLYMAEVAHDTEALLIKHS